MIKYAINTNCLRKHFTRKEIVQLAKKAGVSGIEWGLHELATAASDAREMGTPGEMPDEQVGKGVVGEFDFFLLKEPIENGFVLYCNIFPVHEAIYTTKGL